MGLGDVNSNHHHDDDSNNNNNNNNNETTTKQQRNNNHAPPLNFRKISQATLPPSRSNATPMPSCTEKRLGQPMLRSIPATSCWTSCAALSAMAGREVPSWKTTRSRSRGEVRKATRTLPASRARFFFISFAGVRGTSTKSTVPKNAFSRRSQRVIRRSTSCERRGGE